MTALVWWNLAQLLYNGSFVGYLILRYSVMNGRGGIVSVSLIGEIAAVCVGDRKKCGQQREVRAQFAGLYWMSWAGSTFDLFWVPFLHLFHLH